MNICEIMRTHIQIMAQGHSIGGNNVVTGYTKYLIIKSIRRGKNVLHICVGVLLLTIPVMVYNFGVLVRGINGVLESLFLPFQLWYTTLVYQCGVLMVCWSLCSYHSSYGIQRWCINVGN